MWHIFTKGGNVYMATLRELGIDQLTPLRSGQPCNHFNQDKLKDLADGYRLIGLLQPIVVRQIEEGRFEIIAGERRWRAAPLAGLSEVPCLIKEPHEITSLFVAALTENIQREDLPPLRGSISFTVCKE